MRKLLCLALLCTAMNAAAQYISNGPAGGFGYSFYQENGTTWLAANADVYFSNDNGVSWHSPVTSPSVFGCDNLISIAASNNELYAGSQQSGIFHSLDNGASWSGVNNNLTKGIPYSDVEIAGTNALTIRADSGLLFFTANGGSNWTQINFIINNASAKWLSIHNNAVYLTTNQGLFKSTNNGVSFNIVNPAVAPGKLVWVGDTAYISTATGIVKSTDGGMSFTTVALAGIDVRNATASGAQIVAAVHSATLQDTIKYSADGGATFSAVPFSPSFTFKNVYDIHTAGSNVLIGTNYGLYYSANGGAAWTRADSGFHATVIRGIAVSGTHLYAAAYPMGVYASPDSADSWRHSGDIGHGVEGNIFAVDAKNQYVHAGGSANYYRSNDFGLTWTSGATGLPVGFVSSVYASRSSAEVWVIRNGDLYYSANDGSSFAPVASGVPAGTATDIMRADTAFFILASGGLYKAGSSQAFTLTTGIAGGVTSVVRGDTAYYASTTGSGLYSSPDGAGWTTVTITAPGTLPVKVNALAVPDTGLIAATDDGLYSNRTGVWMRDSLQGRVVRSLAIMHGHVFAGTCGGVWALRNIPPPPPVPTEGVGGVIAAGSTLHVYPNPASGDFRAVLYAAKAGDGALTLRDMMGKTVLRQPMQLNAGRNELHVPATVLHLPPGIYLVQVMADNQIATRRIVLR